MSPETATIIAALATVLMMAVVAIGGWLYQHGYATREHVHHEDVATRGALSAEIAERRQEGDALRTELADCRRDHLLARQQIGQVEAANAELRRDHEEDHERMRSLEIQIDTIRRFLPPPFGIAAHE